VRRLALAGLALLLAGCGSHGAHRVKGAATERCAAGALHRLGSQRAAYAGIASAGARAYRAPGGTLIAHFDPENVNHFPTVFGVTGVVVDAACRPRWYRVQLPMRPNGALGYVRARRLELAHVGTRIVIDVSARRLTVYRGGRRVLSATVAVGSPGTPTPLGHFYVNQRLIPDDARGPFGPAAIGISAFSNVLTGWTQGGPVAIHGTNEPWSIGHAVSNGCIRLPNATLERIYPWALAGTPVVIRA
jgi:L,D-transpeptidase catalytic domain